MIDFGSAVICDPALPPHYHTLFFGTTAYAASEILLKKPYRSVPAEIWTLGVLLSYLLTGHSPFPTEEDAIEGRIVIRERSGSGSQSGSSPSSPVNSKGGSAKRLEAANAGRMMVNEVMLPTLEKVCLSICPERSVPLTSAYF